MLPILNDINLMAKSLNEDEVTSYVNKMTKHLLSSDNTPDIIGLGAGRMGYALRSFIMRLSHMGFNASMIGDTNVPRVKDSTLLIVNSSSGQTPSILQYTQQAAYENGNIFLTSCAPESSIAKYSECMIKIPTIESNQLMKSPYEQFSMLIYDYIVIKLMTSLDLDPEEVSKNHSILE